MNIKQPPSDPRDPGFESASQRARLGVVQETALEVRAVEALVEDERCGAIVTFHGVVRNHDEGRGVLNLVYEGHPDAGSKMAECVDLICTKFPDVVVAAVHRVGALEIGDAALIASVAAPHRARAFEACAELVDLIKAEVPIWKHQFFADGSEEWVGALG